ncbi:3'(2'),5'-bisphosphate nucleotidase CysQ [Rhodobacterales bacterium HKCCE3408]|nr:3'(2'),5'-bisphosphate nucleotidase CysQ [Rhodobacterales bacterium HKCCE3408]
MPDFTRIETIFRKLAIEAGARIMEVYSRADMGVETKGDDSPVTEADRLADALIAEGLREAFPDMALVTEEQADSHGQDVATFLIVDPLDGTKEFIQRRGDFTVNIALVENGVPTRGVVYAPAKGRLFYTDASGRSVEETGALDPEVQGPVEPISVSAPAGALRIVASKSHRNAETEEYLARFPGAETKSAGSSLKFCLVATGEADLYPRLGPTMEWDTAAGDAVLRGAGGKVLSLPGLDAFAYGKAGFRNGHFVAFAPGVDPAP